MAKKLVTINISPKLSEEDWQCIESFKRRVKEVSKTEILSSSGHGIHANIKYDINSGFEIKVDKPKEDYVKSLLMSFRFFYLKSEQTNFLRVLNIVRKHSNSDLVNRHTDKLKKRWTGELFSETIKISVNGEKITTEKLLNLWFNAYYFHSDKVKTKELEKINAVLSEDLSCYFFLNSVYEALKAVIDLYNSITTLKKPQ